MKLLGLKMKVLGLIDLLILILASRSKAQNWDVNVTRHINATVGSNVTIPCVFTYPPELYTKDVQIYWKKPVRSKFSFNDNDRNAFVFHSNSTFVLERYRGKTRLIGNKDKGNCSLMIQDIRENEPNIYLRVIVKGDQYSFKVKFVSISLLGVEAANLEPVEPDVTFTPSPAFEKSTKEVRQNNPPYAAIFVPTAVLLIIISGIGIVFCMKRRRSKSFDREDSGYYANFSRETPNQAKSKAFCEKQDDIKHPQGKVINEPVYINMEVIPDWMHQSVDHTDSLYANVHYSK